MIMCHPFAPNTAKRGKQPVPTVLESGHEDDSEWPSGAAIGKCAASLMPRTALLSRLGKAWLVNVDPEASGYYWKGVLTRSSVGVCVAVCVCVAFFSSGEEFAFWAFILVNSVNNTPLLAIPWALG